MKPDRSTSINMQLAQKCLMLISEFTYRCASSWDPVCFGYALQELGCKLVEREGVSDIWFYPLTVGEIPGLASLLAELELMNNVSKDLTLGSFH